MSLDEELIKDGYESYGPYTLAGALSVAVFLTDGRRIRDVRTIML